MSAEILWTQPAIAAWNEWLGTPEAQYYDGYCQCNWYRDQRERGREYVRRKLAEMKEAAR